MYGASWGGNITKGFLVEVQCARAACWHFQRWVCTSGGRNGCYPVCACLHIRVDTQEHAYVHMKEEAQQCQQENEKECPRKPPHFWPKWVQEDMKKQQYLLPRGAEAPLPCDAITWEMDGARWKALHQRIRVCGGGRGDATQPCTHLKTK